RIVQPPVSHGLYEREGWTAGQTGTRTLTFRRTSGPEQPTPYLVKWIGNDGTFSCADTVRLPKNRDVTLSLTVAPKTAGMHSALLCLQDPRQKATVYDMMTTVVAAEEFGAEDRLQLDVNTEWLCASHYFVRVPAGVTALTIRDAMKQGTLCLLTLRGPDRMQSRPAEIVAGEIVVNTPQAGVWEVMVENGRAKDHRTDIHSCPQVNGIGTLTLALKREPPRAIH
ncbi:MAG TPA: hypothetical protein VKU00_10825, partial [Chthonomonadaceae bacterium]|nr:hypothetical protein [Chthonomonadaceae bacterium]